MSKYYDTHPQEHPVLADIRQKYFPYTWSMFPSEFRIFYQACPVRLPGGGSTNVGILKYVSGWNEAGGGQKYALGKHIRKYYGEGINPELDDWLSTTRPTAVFSGHGLPEEISLVCSLAMATGYKTAGEIGPWATKYIGLDCNGFVSAYLIALGTFSRVLHDHPSYPSVTKLAQSVSEISYDSVILWSKKEGGEYKVVQNPSKSAHIAVVDGWNEHGSSLLVTERGGESRFPGTVGIHYGIYDILDTPPAGCAPAKAGWVIRAREHKSYDKDTVVITRTMEAN